MGGESLYISARMKSGPCVEEPDYSAVTREHNPGMLFSMELHDNVDMFVRVEAETPRFCSRS